MYARILSAFDLLKRVGFALLLCVQISAQAQPPDTLWTQTLGPLDRLEECIGMAPDDQGGVFVVNWSEMDMNQDFKSMVRRVSGNGSLLWQQEYPNLYVTDCASLNGSVYAIGNIYEGRGRGFIVSSDSDGNERWSRDIPAQDRVYVQSIYADSSSRTILIGASVQVSQFQNAPALIAYSDDGDSLWTQTYSYEIGDLLPIHAIDKVGSQLALVTVAELSHPPFLRGERLLWVDEDGAFITEQSVAFEDVRTEVYSISELPNGEFFLGCFADPYSETKRPMVLKYNPPGELMWRHDYDLADSYFINVNSIVALQDGGALFEYTGGFSLELLYDRICLVRIDPDGDTLWTQRLGYADDDFESSNLRVINGHPFVSGTRWAYSDTSLSKHTLAAKYDSIEVMSQVNPLIAPVVEGISLALFPNPFNSTLSISLSIPPHQESTITLYDLLGREVDVIHRGRLENTTLSYTAPASLASGIYFIRAQVGAQTAMRKVALLK